MAPVERRRLSITPPQSKMSPVLQRKRVVISSARTPQSSCKRIGASLTAASPASPVIGRRRPLGGIETKLNKLSDGRQVTATDMKRDNKYQSFNNKTEQKRLASPLQEKENIVHAGKGANIMSPSQIPMKVEKGTPILDKEKISAPLVRKSRRVKKLEEPALQKDDGKAKNGMENKTRGTSAARQKSGKKEPISQKNDGEAKNEEENMMEGKYTTRQKREKKETTSQKNDKEAMIEEENKAGSTSNTHQKIGKKRSTLQKNYKETKNEEESKMEGSSTTLQKRGKNETKKDSSLPLKASNGSGEVVDQSGNESVDLPAGVRYSTRKRTVKPTVEGNTIENKLQKREGRLKVGQDSKQVTTVKVHQKVTEIQEEINLKSIDQEKIQRSTRKTANFRSNKGDDQEKSADKRTRGRKENVDVAGVEREIRISTVKGKKSGENNANVSCKKSPAEKIIDEDGNDLRKTGTRRNRSRKSLGDEINTKIIETQTVTATPGDKNSRRRMNEKDKDSSLTNDETPRTNKSPRNSKEDAKTLTASSPNESIMSNKPKLPIWSMGKKKRQTPVERKRRSLRIQGDVFEFTFNPDEEGAAKKRKPKRAKPRQQRVKPKARTKPTLLTTDPSWQKNLTSFGTESMRVRAKDSSRKKSESSSTKGNESVREEDGDNVTEDVCEGSYDDCFDSYDNEDVFEGFDNETASSFMPPPGTAEQTVSMVSASAVPTPAVSKHISKYVGNSSTPRAENIISLTNSEKEQEPPKEVKEDIAVCFGFDEDSEEENDLTLSPVRRTGQHSQLQITNMTNSFSSDYQCPSQVSNMPSRFSFSTRHPGMKNYSSMSCSASMVTHGRSVSTLSVSGTSLVNQLPESKVNKTSNSSKSVIRSRNDTTLNKQKKQSTRKKKTLAREGKEPEVDTNASLLFEEEATEKRQLTIEEVMINHPPRKEQLSSSGNEFDGTLSKKSPEKSFSKPPRKSYDRSVLEELRKSFLLEHRGGDTTTTETEEEEEITPEKPSKRKKVVTKRAPKRTKKPAANISQSSNDSSISDTSTVDKPVPEKKKKKKKKVDTVFEQSADEWASDLNTHFSDVEAFELVIG